MTLKIINNESEISSKISLAKKPIFIIGIGVRT